MLFPVDERFVQDTERKLGARLPESLRQFVMAENGSQISTAEDDWDMNPILDSSDNERLSSTCYDIVRETREAKVWRNFPEHAVSIAQNGLGDHLVLLKVGDEFDPTVYFWSHETGERTAIASDFSQLLD